MVGMRCNLNYIRGWRSLLDNIASDDCQQGCPTQDVEGGDLNQLQLS